MRSESSYGGKEKLGRLLVSDWARERASVAAGEHGPAASLPSSNTRPRLAAPSIVTPTSTAGLEPRASAASPGVAAAALCACTTTRHTASSKPRPELKEVV